MKIYDYNGKKNICGHQIKVTRKRKHVTQAQLAAWLQLNGITIERDSISRIEIGTRFVTDYELKVISELLGVPMEDLLDDDMPETYK